ncbi:N-acetyllactosaminide beta-1,3-N-acetylglucosaminyltransferase 3-like [Patiria miniata]|uniref:Hexosyltransferase n=1 Tax=Patiria miniata TaxID=46514 RepID=A0A914B4P1_PATMI|nr:N-acetyllactosaminide beta-1,3-N-acetylglucosaminyltransferase 3-like [Patiria miniata]XP_038070451.1 N-acetyllactosaminide beta-1,3-N-acetylglucosaminyltransferase 3-like [Patiria miniata]
MAVRTTFLQLLLITAAALILPVYFAVWKFLIVDPISQKRLRYQEFYLRDKMARGPFLNVGRPHWQGSQIPNQSLDTVKKMAQIKQKPESLSEKTLATDTNQNRKDSKSLQTSRKTDDALSKSRSPVDVRKEKYQNVDYGQSCKFLKTSKGLHRVCIDRYSNGSRGRLTAKAVMAQKRYYTKKPVLVSHDVPKPDAGEIGKENSDDGEMTQSPVVRNIDMKPRRHRDATVPSRISKPSTRGILDNALWLSYIDPHDYRYLVNPATTTCQTHDRIDLLVLVTSHPNNNERRAVIRETWGAPRGSTALSAEVRVRFLLGVTNLTSGRTLPSDLQREVEEYDDLIVEDFLDSYLNLTTKTVMGLKWASRFCPDARYVMKTDDDIIVNIPKILAFLHTAPRRVLIAGRLAKSYPVLRDKWEKFYVPKDIYSKSTYPDYCVGLGYIMSTDLVNRLYLQSLLTPLFPWEDVYVGIMLKEIGIIPKDIKNFYYFNGGSLFQGDAILVAPKKTLYRLRSFYMLDGLTPTQTRILWKQWRG